MASHILKVLNEAIETQRLLVWVSMESGCVVAEGKWKNMGSCCGAAAEVSRLPSSLGV